MYVCVYTCTHINQIQKERERERERARESERERGRVRECVCQYGFARASMGLGRVLGYSSGSNELLSSYR